MDYLVSHSEKLEEGAINNSNLKVNVADTNFIESYLPEDSYYDNATDLVASMGEIMSEQDVDIIHSVLLCNQVLQEGRPGPKTKLRQKPSCPKLQIIGSVWTDISPELRSAWAQEDDKIKEQVITQFKVPITKNCQLTAYKA